MIGLISLFTSLISLVLLYNNIVKTITIKLFIFQSSLFRNSTLTSHLIDKARLSVSYTTATLLHS